MMKNTALLFVAFAAFVLVVCSEPITSNEEDSSEEMKRGHHTIYEEMKRDDDTTFEELPPSSEELENDRRKSPQCEPCGISRRPCCFPDLCQHRVSRPSKCYTVKG
jgi:hypothetical protein